MKELVGKTVKAVYKSGDEVLMFETDQGDIAYITEADCCNSVWFNHFDNVEAFNDAKVISFEPCGWLNVAEDDWSVTELCFLKFVTTKGLCTIEIRNSHNGFYGGYIRKLEDPTEFDYELIEEDY